MHASVADPKQAIAYPLPVHVIAEMLGIPHAMHDRLLEWTNVIAQFCWSSQSADGRDDAANAGSCVGVDEVLSQRSGRWCCSEAYLPTLTPVKKFLSSGTCGSQEP